MSNNSTFSSTPAATEVTRHSLQPLSDHHKRPVFVSFWGAVLSDAAMQSQYNSHSVCTACGESKFTTFYL